MAKKINVKLILELRSAGMGRNAIATSRHISKNSVGDVFHIADRMGISYEDIAQMVRMRFIASFIRTSLPWKTCMTSQITSMSTRN